MILFDVNILIYTHRGDQASHKIFKDRFIERISQETAFGFSCSIAGGYVRIVTQSSFPNGPTPLSLALAHIDHMIRMPNFVWANPGDAHWNIVDSLCRNANITGKRVADAQHAAIAVEHAATWISADTDFNLFTSSGLQFEHWPTHG